MPQNKVKNILLSLAMYATFHFATAQQEYTLPFMTQIYQSSYVNVANVPTHKISIGLPGISSVNFGFATSGFSYYDGFDKYQGSNALSINQIIAKASTSNYIGQNLSVDLMHLRVKWKQAYIGFNITHKESFQTSFPKDFFLLASANLYNEDYSGKTLDLTKLGMAFNNYTEYGISYNRSYKAFSFGGRVKYLQGLSNISYSADRLTIKTGQPNSEIVVNEDIRVQSSGILASDSLELKKIDGSYFLNFKNPGFGLDLGFNYRWKKFEFGAAVNNFGMIFWNNQNHALSVNLKGNTAGLDLTKALVNISDNKIVIADTLKKIFDPKVSSSSSYIGVLVPQLYLSGKYQVLKPLSLHLALIFESYKTIRAGVVAAAQYNFQRKISLTLSSSYRYERLNFGTGLVINPGPIQFYIVGDNLFSMYFVDEQNLNFPLPWDSRLFNLRTGINLLHGFTT